MRERARRPPALPARTSRVIGVTGKQRRQDLDRNLAVQPLVARPVDLAHAPGANRRDDLIGAKNAGWDERRPGA